MVEFEQFIAGLQRQELMFDDKVVILTGRYAIPVNGPNVKLGTIDVVLNVSRVEIKSPDPDLVETRWVKPRDLLVIQERSK
jgi:hypothetical protein